MCKKIVDIDAAAAAFEVPLKQLEALGFSNKKKNVKLLYATNGDVEVVKNFLAARESLRLKRREHCQLLRQDDKLARKLEKQENRKEKKKERREKKDRKGGRENKRRGFKTEPNVETNENNNNPVAVKEEPISFIKPTQEQWPSDVAHLYLDGNNMLYVVGAIRSLVLKRKNSVAESYLESFARTFSDALKLKHCTLVFDETKKLVSGESFSVCSARPTFKTSDDALVEWAKACEHPAVFVTSDRELTHRLKECGSKIILCKPKEWFYYAATVLASSTGEKVGKIDDWMYEWMKKNQGIEDIAKNLQNKLTL